MSDTTVMCCLCFDSFTLDQLSERNGQREDVCKACAIIEIEQAHFPQPTVQAQRETLHRVLADPVFIKYLLGFGRGASTVLVALQGWSDPMPDGEREAVWQEIARRSQAVREAGPDGYAALAGSQNAEDAAYHQAMRSRPRDRDVADRVSDARDLAQALYQAARYCGCDVTEYDPLLESARLPGWLTGFPAAPESWARGD